MKATLAIALCCLFVLAAHVDAAPETGCACSRIYLPVCSTSGNTFANNCELVCSGQEKASDGACPEK